MTPAKESGMCHWVTHLHWTWRVEIVQCRCNTYSQGPKCISRWILNKINLCMTNLVIFTFCEQLKQLNFYFLHTCNSLTINQILISFGTFLDWYANNRLVKFQTDIPILNVFFMTSKLANISKFQLHWRSSKLEMSPLWYCWTLISNNKVAISLFNGLIASIDSIMKSF